MGNWYRRPKRLNLRFLIRDSGCEFVFDALQISSDEFLELQSGFFSKLTPQRLRRGRISEHVPSRSQIDRSDICPLLVMTNLIIVTR
jgi:hypothetical protein